MAINPVLVNQVSRGTYIYASSTLSVSLPSGSKSYLAIVSLDGDSGGPSFKQLIPPAGWVQVPDQNAGSDIGGKPYAVFKNSTSSPGLNWGAKSNLALVVTILGFDKEFEVKLHQAYQADGTFSFGAAPEKTEITRIVLSSASDVAHSGSLGLLPVREGDAEFVSFAYGFYPTWSDFEKLILTSQGALYYPQGDTSFPIANFNPSQSQYSYQTTVRAEIVIGALVSPASGTTAAKSTSSGKVALKTKISGSIKAISRTSGSAFQKYDAAGKTFSKSTTMGLFSARSRSSATVKAKATVKGATYQEYKVAGTVKTTSATKGSPVNQNYLSGTSRAVSRAIGKAYQEYKVSSTVKNFSWTMGNSIFQNRVKDVVVSSTSGTRGSAALNNRFFIKWGAVEQRFFEYGVDRGVLYVEGSDGIAWNGLISVEEKPLLEKGSKYYQDGFRYHMDPTLREFAGTIKAYTYPEKFEECMGMMPIDELGISLDEQIAKPFGFSYRTVVGTNIGPEGAYKIHLVYNAQASNPGVTRQTVGDAFEAAQLTWDFETIPMRKQIPGAVPFSHVVIDSRKVDKAILQTVEQILYGKDLLRAARLPSLNELIDLLTPPPAPVPEYETITFRNLFTNPRFEKTSGTVEVFRNRALYPIATLSQGGWSPSWGVNGAGTSSIESDMYKMVWSSAATANFARLGISSTVSTQVAVTAGETVVASLNVASNKPLNVYIDLQGASGWVGNRNIVQGFTPSSNIDIPTRISSSVVIPDGVSYIRLFAQHTALPVVGDWLAAGSFMVGSVDATYFDGSYSPDPDLTPSWTGAENASESVLRGDRISVITASQYLSPAYRTIDKKAKIVATTISDDSWIGSESYHPVMIPGGTYTVLAYCENLVTSGVNAARILVTNQTWGLIGKSESVPAGVSQWVRLKLTIPTSATIVRLRFYAGINNETTGSVYWSNVLVVKGDYDGPFFSGDTPAFTYKDQTVVPQWEGEPNNSPSFFDYKRLVE